GCARSHIRAVKQDEPHGGMERIYSTTLSGPPYLVPPGVPADRVAALRTALAAMLADPALLEDAQRSGLDIGPMGGEELQALVARLYALPPNLLHRPNQSLLYRPPPPHTRLPPL